MTSESLGGCLVGWCPLRASLLQWRIPYSVRVVSLFHLTASLHHPLLGRDPLAVAPFLLVDCRKMSQVCYYLYFSLAGSINGSLQIVGIIICTLEYEIILPAVQTRHTIFTLWSGFRECNSVVWPGSTVLYTHHFWRSSFISNCSIPHDTGCSCPALVIRNVDIPSHSPVSLWIFLFF